MNVLMVEELSPLGAETARALRDAHMTVRCCRDSLHTFACRALLGAECPLDAVPIDAMVAVRAEDQDITTYGRNRSEVPTLGEEGIVCAIRRHVPLLMVCDTGDPWGGPFDEWIETACVHDEVAEEADGVVKGRSQTYSAVATDALSQALRLYGVEDPSVVASVVRKDGRLGVTVDLPDGMSKEVRDGCSVKVYDALHRFDPWIATIDVKVG